MQALPAVAARLGAPALLRLVGGLGLAWLALWRLTLARLRAAGPAAAAGGMSLHSRHADAVDGGGGRAGIKGRPGATPWRAMLRHPAARGDGGRCRHASPARRTTAATALRMSLGHADKAPNSPL